MLNINEIHGFYEANMPGYERKDFLVISKFFVEEMKLPGKKPLKAIWNNYQSFKEFVCFDWFGWDEIGTKKLSPENKKPKGKKKHRDYGKCKCGGFMVRKQNRETKEHFLGCSTYPKCRNTKPLIE
jgi:hypothetical protein